MTMIDARDPNPGHADCVWCGCPRWRLNWSNGKCQCGHDQGDHWSQDELTS